MSFPWRVGDGENERGRIFPVIVLYLTRPEMAGFSFPSRYTSRKSPKQLTPNACARWPRLMGGNYFSRSLKDFAFLGLSKLLCRGLCIAPFGARAGVVVAVFVAGGDHLKSQLLQFRSCSSPARFIALSIRRRYDSEHDSISPSKRTPNPDFSAWPFSGRNGGSRAF